MTLCLYQGSRDNCRLALANGGIVRPDVHRVAGPRHHPLDQIHSVRSARRTRLLLQNDHPYPSLSPNAAKLAEQRAPDYYDLLAVPASASAADVKAAYHRALLASHPDKHGASLRSDVDIGPRPAALATSGPP